MAAPRKAPKSRQEGISIDIRGVSPTTKLGELTVSQFVELLVQVSNQLTVARIKGDPAVMGPVIQRLRELMTSQQGAEPSAIKDIVQQTQQAILARMPELMRQAAATSRTNAPANSDD